ncbi:uncharacterized protein LOC144162393 isoform X2 [Haemaphysalis longicornis]
MARTFTLAGFSEAIDWRPLKFVEPVPAAAICDSCGYVPRSTCLLPCGHTLCESCRRRCVTADGAKFECPFDGDMCSSEDIARRDYSGNLTRRKVHCWNEANGCTAILPASEIAAHFRRDCQHHGAHCPTCLANVLWNDVCAHQKSRCTNLVFHAAAEAEPDTGNNEEEPLVAIERKVDQEAAQLDAKLAQLSLESGSKSDRLLELCRGASNLNETLRGQFYAALAINDHRLERNAAAIRAAYLAKGNALMSAIVSMPPTTRNDAETREWVLTGYAAHVERAMKEGYSIEMTEKAYLHHYLMSWGVYLKRSVDTVCICLRHCLHEGRYDQFLDWPYTHEMKLVVIHPDTREEREIHVAPCTSNNAEARCRPAASSNKAISYPFTSFRQGDVEHGGFVKNDQLLLRFEVLL